MNTSTHTNGAAQPRGSREKVTFDINIPQVVKLDFNPPTDPRDGLYGPQFMYFVDDGARILWADPALHEELIAISARAGDTIAIVKRKRGRAVTWEANQVKDGRVQPAAASPRRSAAPSAQTSSHAAEEEIAEAVLLENPMTAALRQAIDACAEAGFEATHEDIRALAITIYIAISNVKAGRK